MADTFWQLKIAEYKQKNGHAILDGPRRAYRVDFWTYKNIKYWPSHGQENS
jgi:hypothetical protein